MNESSNPFEYLIGQSWKAVEDEVRSKYKMGRIRVYAANQIITADYVMSRLNIVLNDQNQDTIVRTYFG